MSEPEPHRRQTESASSVHRSTAHTGPHRRATTRKRRPVLARRGRHEALTALSQPLTWSRPPAPPPSGPSPFRPLRILMVGWEFPPHHSGGLGVHCYELVRELAAVGHRISFLVPFADDYTPVPGVEMYWPGPPTSPAVGGAYDLPISRDAPLFGTIEAYNEWIASFQPPTGIDVVHVHDWFGTVGGLRLARRLGCPLVVTIHSTEYDRSLGHPWEEILFREQVGIRTADRVIAVSRHLKQQLVDRYHAAPDRVQVIYNAVRPPPRVERISPAQPTVLYLGRLAAMKGVDTFLRAAARVSKLRPDALFVVAGEGPEFPRLLALAAHLGIADRALFLGRVTEEERIALLARADVFVMPSVVEPFGIAALEAMAAGVPTILSRTSGVSEVSGHSFTVDFWDIDEFASRMSELLAYPELGRIMGASGREDALRTGWAERALETLGVYSELLLHLGRR